MKLLLINLSVNDNGPAIIHSNGNKIYTKIITSISLTQQEVEIEDNDYEKLTKSFMVEFKGLNYYGVTYQTYNTPVIKQTIQEQPKIIQPIEEVKEILQEDETVIIEVDLISCFDVIKETFIEEVIIDQIIDEPLIVEPIIEKPIKKEKPIKEEIIEIVKPIIKNEVTEKVQPIKETKKKPVKTSKIKDTSEDLYNDKTTDLYLDKSDDLYTE